MPSFLLVAVLLSAASELWADQTSCPGLGTYTNQSPFQLFPLPECPEVQGINMQVYTRENPKDGQIITRDTIPACYKDGKPTYFLVHGWSQNENYTWLHEMKDALLEQGDYIVIICGWKIGAYHDYYPQSASNTRTVGGEIALIATNLINKRKSSRDKLCCVGHSLGAHICGFAGQRVKFGRITGLDPAGPLFETADLSVGLNPSCADFVDNIHTTGRSGIGICRAIGHVDFYPNGGIAQPGCTSDSATELKKWPTDYLGWTADQQDASLALIVMCSHLRAHELFKESIRRPGFITRCHCSTPLLLSALLCPKDATQSMGFYANTYAGRGIFYLETNSVPPYSRG